MRVTSSPAQRQHVGVPNEAALSAAAPSACTTLRLKVGVFDEATLSALRVNGADAHCTQYGDGSEPWVRQRGSLNAT